MNISNSIVKHYYDNDDVGFFLMKIYNDKTTEI